MTARLQIRVKFRAFGVTLGTWTETFKVRVGADGRWDVSLSTERPPEGLPPRIEWRGASVWLW
jgi:hypothetical protein